LGKITKLIAKRLDTEFFLTSGNLTKKTSRLVSLIVERWLVFYFAFIYPNPDSYCIFFSKATSFI